MYCQIRFDILYYFAVFFVILISVSNISPRIIVKRKSHGRRYETTLYLRQKRCWKFPQKREHERWGKVWYTPSLKLFTFRTLKILWFNCFRLKKHMYCQIPFGLLYRSAVFFIVILISVSNISPRIIMKRKSHGRTKETTLYLRQKRYWKFAQKREYQTSTSLQGSSLFWGSREKSRESSTRKETRVRGAGWEARSLSSRLNFNSCLARYSFSWQFRSIVEPWRFCGLQALLVTDTIFSLPLWPRKVWNSFQQDPEADREFVKITRSHLNMNCWR